ncbi:hypothetical protein [Burkholderia cenocepacia]|uniref:hypothetical protein n=1 Tax=Burkholderia cenocepacia TaxID=95486 RepID=UPI003D7682F4
MWSQAQSCWSADGEHTRRHGKFAGDNRFAAAVSPLCPFALQSSEVIITDKANIPSLRSACGSTRRVRSARRHAVSRLQRVSIEARYRAPHRRNRQRRNAVSP